MKSSLVARWFIFPVSLMVSLAVGAIPTLRFETETQAVAVKNVTAWPNLTPLADGSIIASIFNQPSHGFWEGDVDCWGTTDAGASWQLRGTPAPHEPTTNRMNVAAGTNAKGELIVLAAGWSHRPPPPPKGTPRRHDPPAVILPIWVCRSTDGGRTWTRTEGVELPSKSRLAAQGIVLSDHLFPFGDIIRLADGKLGVCLYAPKSLGVPNSKHEHVSYFFTSADDGLTWTLTGVIGQDDVNETTPLLLPDGSLLACGRTTLGRHLELFRSADHGATWKAEGPVTASGEHPADLTALADGRIVLTYGDRNGALPGSKWPDGLPGSGIFPHGIEVRVSSDAGRTWSAPERIATFDGDGGYPATVQLTDGRLLTAYYAKRTPLHEGYQMATVTWKLTRTP